MPLIQLSWNVEMEKGRRAMWTLIFIVLMETEVVATNVGTYNTMYECFAEREQLAVTAGGEGYGYFPLDMQGICIQREGKE